MYVKEMKSILEEYLPEKEMRLFQVIAQTAEETGMSVYLIGGIVRDILLGIQSLDVDLVVEGDGILFATVLVKKIGGKIRVHEKFCAGVIVLENGIKVDVATARMEYYLYPGALPSIKKSSIKADLFRRDFSINSQAIKLNGKNAFFLIDCFNGQRDIKDKTIRILHNRSFIEDPTRIFRAVRFEQRFGFALEKQTLALLESAVKKKTLDGLSGYRVWSELRIMLRETKPIRCIRRMKELGLFGFIHPDFYIDSNSLRGLELIPRTITDSKVDQVLQKPETWKVYLYGLLLGTSEGVLEKIMERLNFSRRLAQRTRNDFRGCRRMLRILQNDKEPSSYELYEVFSELSIEAIFWLMALEGNGRLNQYVLLFYTQYRSIAKISLTGNDFLAMGFETGPIFQEIFRSLRKARLEGRIKSRKDEVQFIEKKFPRVRQ